MWIDGLLAELLDKKLENEYLEEKKLEEEQYRREKSTYTTYHDPALKYFKQIDLIRSLK